MNNYKLYKLSSLLRKVPAHDIIVLTKTKETQATQHEQIPRYLQFNLPAFIPPNLYPSKNAASRGIKILYKSDMTDQLTI